MDAPGDKITIDPSRPATLAQQIREQVTWLISSGTLGPGDELRSVRGLAADLGVNLHTVRAAYRQLDRDGLVDVRHGQRTRVAAFDPGRFWTHEAATRSHTVGVVLPSLGDPFYVPLLEAIEEEATAAGSLVLVCTTHDDQALALRSVAQLGAKGIDGLILVSHDVSNLLLASGGRRPSGGVKIPVVVVDRPGVEGDSIETDLEGAGHQATRHLLGHGFRSIALLTPGSRFSNALPIEAGYRRALREADRPPEPELVTATGSFRGADAGDAAADLLGRADRPSAIVAATDVFAVETIRAARRMGLAVPDEVAVVGIGDIPLVDLVDPPLTTVALHAREMGAQAMRALDRLLTGPSPAGPVKLMIPTHLVVRESCGSHASA